MLKTYTSTHMYTHAHKYTHTNVYRVKKSKIKLLLKGLPVMTMTWRFWIKYIRQAIIPTV